MTPFHTHSRKDRHAGFTLLEIMVAMVLAGVLAVGMQNLYAMLGEEVQEFNLRQKAVFVLNGEMEKLYSIFHSIDNSTVVGNAVLVADAGYTGVFPPHIFSGGGTNHQILDDTPANNFVITSTAVFTQETNEQPDNEASILYYTDTGGQPRNAVWLDFEKKITARVSWIATPVPDSGSTACYGDCYLITLYLDYPFRYVTDPAVDPLSSMGGRVNTLVLRTIVGRWNQS